MIKLLYSFNAFFIATIGPSAGPVIVRAFSSNSSTITLEWIPPNVEARNGLIREYHIVIEEEETGTSWVHMTTDKSKTITSLHPSYVYVCEVHAVTVSRGQPSEVVYITTQEDGTSIRFNIDSIIVAITRTQSPSCLNLRGTIPGAFFLILWVAKVHRTNNAMSV